VGPKIRRTFFLLGSVEQNLHLKSWNKERKQSVNFFVVCSIQAKKKISTFSIYWLVVNSFFHYFWQLWFNSSQSQVKKGSLSRKKNLEEKLKKAIISNCYYLLEQVWLFFSLFLSVLCWLLNIRINFRKRFDVVRDIF
jgi:hypothetical protein